MRILVSACLLGLACKYSGIGNPDPRVMALTDNHEVIPVCPEQLGGLPTPRPAAERSNGRIINRKGADVTAEFIKGAEETLKLARLFHCDTAILKSRSPSCGFGTIYDGTFSGTLTEGSGITAERLCEAGLRVFTEDQWTQWTAYEHLMAEEHEHSNNKRR
jgi:uncharacterized protein YbbK (DUF523 family)